MAKKFLTSIDLSKCELLNASIHNLAAAPAAPADGQIYFNTADGQMYYYNGSAWQSMSGDITSVAIVAAGGLTGDSSTTNGAFSATLAVGAGTGITVNADDVAIKNASNLAHFYLTKWDALGGNQLASSVIADDGATALVYGPMNVSGDITLDGGNRTIVADAGTLRIEGTTFDGNNVSIPGNLSVTGTSTLTGAVSTGAGLTVGTDLAVTSNATVGGTLNVGGAADFASNVIVRGDLTVIGTATNVTFESTTVQLGDAYLTLNQGHDRQLPAATDAGWVVIRSEVEGNISVLWSEEQDKFVFANVGNEDGTIAPANVAWGSTVDILAGAATFEGALSAPSAAITNNATVGGTLDVTGATSVDGTLTLGSVAADDTATVIGVDGSGVVKSISTSAIVASGMTFKYSDDGGTATALASSATLTINAGEGLTASGSGSTITLVGENASTTNKGIASFASADFGVASGAVSLNDAVVKTITTDSGALTPASHRFDILGGEGIDVTHTGSVITVAAEDATTSNKGVVELATSAETNALTDTARAVTPAGLAKLRFAGDVPAVVGGVATVSHSLNSVDVIVQVYEKATMASIECDVTRVSPDEVELAFCGDHEDAVFRILVMKVA